MTAPARAPQSAHTVPDTAEPLFPSLSPALERVVATTVELGSPAEVERAMAQFDGEQFMAEIMGQAVDKWFYSFKVSGKTIEGVSAKGAHEFARLRAEQGFPIRFPSDGIRVEEVRENGELGIRALVTARDYRNGMEAVGMAFYPHYVETRDRGKEFDRMASRKALSVAERNAILRLVPEHVIAAALKDRATLVAENSKQFEEDRRRAIANRPQAPTVNAEEERRRPRDPYEQPHGHPAAAPLSEAGRLAIPFGPTRGTPIGQLPTEDLEGALKWARKNNKYEEFCEAAGEVLADRAGR